MSRVIVDVESDGSIFAVSNLSPSQLPDTLPIDITIDIKEQKWSVLSAELLEKTQFLKTGKLRLVHSRLTTVNPVELLFSRPTISDDPGNCNFIRREAPKWQGRATDKCL